MGSGAAQTCPIFPVQGLPGADVWSFLRGQQAEGIADRVIVQLPRTGRLPQTFVTLGGRDGAELWRATFNPVEPAANVFQDARISSATERDLVAVLPGDAVAGQCAAATVTAIRGRDGEILASSSVPFGQQGSGGWGTLYSTESGDLNGDGLDEFVLEYKVADRSSGRPLDSHTEVVGGRDITTDVPWRGWISVVEGATTRELVHLERPTSFGPGPMAIMTESGGNAFLVAALESAPSAGDEVRTRFEGWAQEARVWMREINLLRAPWGVFQLRRGPAFVTARPRVPELDFANVVHDLVRVTLVDPTTGAVTWLRDLPIGAGWVWEVSGDLLLFDTFANVLMKLDGWTGSTIWSRPIDSISIRARYLGGDLSGDGVDDVLDPYALTGPAIISGATGAVEHRPQWLASQAVIPVGDLDGDGSDDIIAVTTPSASSGSDAGSPAAVVAYRGADGLPMWTALLPPAGSGDGIVGIGVDLASGSNRDVVVYRVGIDITALRGDDGRAIWQRESPAYSP